MTRAFVALGANLGEPAATLARALADLAATPGMSLTGISRFYRSAPVGPAPQPEYVNAVARIESALDPHALLDVLLGTETRHGRVRDGRRWGPRLLDLDLLLYGDLRMQDERLCLPHPEMARRNFVLAPLVDLDPDVVIPGHGRAVELLAAQGWEGLLAIPTPAGCPDLPAAPGR